MCAIKDLHYEKKKLSQNCSSLKVCAIRKINSKLTSSVNRLISRALSFVRLRIYYMTENVSCDRPGKGSSEKNCCW